MRRYVLRLERWVFDDESTLIGFGKLMLVICVPLAVLFGALMYVDGRDRRACLDRGGQLAYERTRGMRWNPATKTMMPYTDGTYICLEPRGN